MSIRIRATCTDCGYSGAYKSESLARFHFGQHSCERGRRIAERKARGEARRAAIDRTPQPCLHKQAHHQHGTRACAVLDRCRCLPCARANAAAERHRKHQIAYGRWNPYVDAQPTREHVETLRAAGMGLKQVAKVSGVSHGALSKLMYRERGRAPSKRIRWETAVRLQTVTADLSTLADRNFVDGTGTRRRLRALVTIGWSQSRLAARLGTNPSNFWKLMAGEQRLRVETVRAVRALYDELWATPPSATAHRDKISVNRARTYAKARGWAPPLAWNEDNIDDPAAQPDLDGSTDRPDPTSDGWDEADAVRTVELDEVAVERFMHGTLRIHRELSRNPELVEAIRRLAAHGRNDTEIGDRVGATPTNITAIRLRKGIPAGVISRAERTA